MKITGKVDQALQFKRKGRIFAGDLISKDETTRLMERGLVQRDDDELYSLTPKGKKYVNRVHRRYIDSKISEVEKEINK